MFLIYSGPGQCEMDIRTGPGPSWRRHFLALEPFLKGPDKQWVGYCDE